MRQESLGNVCSIRNGYAFKSTEFQTEGTPLLRISSFDDGEVSIDDKTVFVSNDNLSIRQDFIVEKGDILIALSGATTGKYGVYNLEYPSLLNQRIGLLKSGQSNRLDSKYFYHFLSILKKEILRKAGGAAQPNISTKAIGELKIPLPPLPEQKRIAALLDEADKLRQLNKNLLTKYNELTQSLFLDMFGDPVTNPLGWEVIKMKEYINIKHGFAFKSEYFVADSTHVLLTPGNFFEQGGYKNQGSRQKFYKGDIPKDYILKGKDILIAMTEQAAGLLGSSLIVPDEGLFLHNQRLGLIEYLQELDSIFVFHLFNQKSIRLRIHSEATGTKVRHTSPSKMLAIEIGLPPINLQNKFASRVAVIEQQKAQAQESLTQSENLFNSLLQKAFKGELV